MHDHSRENASHGLELIDFDPFVRSVRPAYVARAKQGYGLIKQSFEESSVCAESDTSDGGNMSRLSLDGLAEMLDEYVVCIGSCWEEAPSPPLYYRRVLAQERICLCGLFYGRLELSSCML